MATADGAGDRGKGQPARSLNSVLSQKPNHNLTTFAKGIPHGRAPFMNHLVPLRASGLGHNGACGDRSTVDGQCDYRPRAFVASELYVRPLHLSPGQMLLHVQVKADQGEGEPNRFVALLETLRGEGIRNVLVNEGWIAMGKGITAQPVIGFLI